MILLNGPFYRLDGVLMFCFGIFVEGFSLVARYAMHEGVWSECLSILHICYSFFVCIFFFQSGLGLFCQYFFFIFNFAQILSVQLTCVTEILEFEYISV